MSGGSGVKDDLRDRYTFLVEGGGAAVTCAVLVFLLRGPLSVARRQEVAGRTFCLGKALIQRCKRQFQCLCNRNVP
ncbi:MAG TPA: hypothetical protein VG897_06560, partial [Terriglobales bacterium]|nr:hypothetical protein [Terriglobales bacterium]